MYRSLQQWLFVALAAVSTFGYAQTGVQQTPAQIQKAVEEFLRIQTAGLPGKVSYLIGAVDPRIVLPACPTPETFLPQGARLWGATSVGVRCSGAAPWSIFVTVQIKVIGNYVVTARPLTQGQALTATDVAVQSGDLSQLPAGILTDPRLALGKTLSSGLAAGEPLRQESLRSPFVVQQGQNVKLQSTGRGFRVVSDGRSLSNAAAGQVAQVRTANGQTVSGIAWAGGVVEITF